MPIFFHRHWATLLLGLLCLLADALLLVDLRQSHRNTLNEARQALHQTSESALRRSETLLDKVDRTLTGIIEVVQFSQRELHVDDIELHRLLLRRHAITPVLHWLSLIDPAGKLVHFSLSFPPPALDLRERPHFYSHLENLDGNQLFVGHTQRGISNTQDFIPLSRAIHDNHGQLIGVAAASIAAERLREEVLLNPSPLQDIKILLNSGYALACAPALTDCLERTWPEPSGDNILVLRSTLYPIHVTASFDRQRALASWQQHAINTVVFGLLANIAILLLGQIAQSEFRRRRAAAAELHESNRLLESRVAERTAALRASEARVQQILTASPVAMLLVNTEGLIVQANRHAEQLFGRGENSLPGLSVDVLVPLPHAEEHAQQRAAFLNASGQRRMGMRRDVEARTLTGTSVPVEIGLGTMNFDGEHFVIVTANDISGRKQLEQRNLALLHRLQLAIDAADIGIWSLNFASGKLLWDARLRHWYDLPAEISDDQLTYEFWRSRIHPEDIAVTEARLAAARELKTVQIDEFRVITRAGLIRYMQSAYIVERDSDTQPTQIIGINRDITAQRVLERSLEAARESAEVASQAKSAFVATMSHEIRTPMNAIIGMTQIVLDSALTPQQQDYLQKVQRAARTLLRILNDILDYSKIEAGQMSIEARPFILAEPIRNVASLFELPCRDKGLAWQLTLADDLPAQVVGDALRLEQILMNLVSNAIKFTAHGSVQLTVSALPATASDRPLRFSVCDTGIGLQAGQREQIFSAFVQADNSIARRFGGTGLGLSIVKDLVEIQGGTIEVISTPGQGSCFHVTLPYPQGHGAALPAARENSAVNPTPTPTPISGKPLSPGQIARLTPCLQELAGQLAGNKLSAGQLLESIENQLREFGMMLAFQDVSEATRQLRFREAEAALAAFQTRFCSGPEADDPC